MEKAEEPTQGYIIKLATTSSDERPTSTGSLEQPYEMQLINHPSRGRQEDTLLYQLLPPTGQGLPKWDRLPGTSRWHMWRLQAGSPENIREATSRLKAALYGPS